jgi:hypothetical protein
MEASLMDAIWTRRGSFSGSRCRRSRSFQLEGYGNDWVPSEEQVLDWTDRLYLKVEPQEDRKLDLWPTCLR